MRSGSSLREYRRSRKVTLQELAAELHVAPSTISRWERKTITEADFFNALALVERIVARRPDSLPVDGVA